MIAAGGSTGKLRETSGCHDGPMSERKPAECWLVDMDAVLAHEGQPIRGAEEFIRRLA